MTNKFLKLGIVVIILFILFKLIKNDENKLYVEPFDPHTILTQELPKLNNKEININPESLKNPRNPFVQPVTITVSNKKTQNSNPNLILNGIVSQNGEYLAMISNQGKIDFYSKNQQIFNYLITNINMDSVTFYDQKQETNFILKLKE